MLRKLNIKNFKSWRATQDISFAPITAIFGANSSGKSSLLQLLLLLKQTVEDTDRFKVLNFGDSKSIIELDNFQNILYKNDLLKSLEFSLEWTFGGLELPIEINIKESNILSFYCKISKADEDENFLSVKSFYYQISNYLIMRMDRLEKNLIETSIEYVAPSNQNHRGYIKEFPFRFYNFPNSFYKEHILPDEISEIPKRFEKLLEAIKYLGPIRELPVRYYAFAGTSHKLTDVGSKGENAIVALISYRSFFPIPPMSLVNKRGQSTPEVKVGEYLKKMKLVYDFIIEKRDENSQEYTVYVQHKENSPKTTIADVGIGISQVLPVLVQCALAKSGDILIFEQPELHLHPSAQYALADVFIETMNNGVQIILESHSEYLLHRLLRRIAEEKIDSTDVSVYFTEFKDDESKIKSLDIDEYGNIRNWPEDFFGDQMEEISNRSLAELDRKKRNTGD